jgi:hypothetical protein
MRPKDTLPIPSAKSTLCERLQRPGLAITAICALAHAGSVEAAGSGVSLPNITVTGDIHTEPENRLLVPFVALPAERRREGLDDFGLEIPDDDDLPKEAQSASVPPPRIQHMVRELVVHMERHSGGPHYVESSMREPPVDFIMPMRHKEPRNIVMMPTPFDRRG